MADDQPIPDAEAFAEAFESLAPLHTNHLELLRAHYSGINHIRTATQLAGLVGYANFNAVNLQYGLLANRVGAALGIRDANLSLLVNFTEPDSHGNELWEWEMRAEVADAMVILGWAGSDEFALPDEVSPGFPLREGAMSRIIVNAFERNREGRRLCIAAHGTNCCICGFDFGKAYGPTADGYIHVHHILPLSEIREEYAVNPVEDLRPVCPNCHAMLHLERRCRTLDEVRQLLKDAVN